MAIGPVVSGIRTYRCITGIPIYNPSEDISAPGFGESFQTIQRHGDIVDTEDFHSGSRQSAKDPRGGIIAFTCRFARTERR